VGHPVEQQPRGVEFGLPPVAGGGQDPSLPTRTDASGPGTASTWAASSAVSTAAHRREVLGHDAEPGRRLAAIFNGDQRHRVAADQPEPSGFSSGRMIIATVDRTAGTDGLNPPARAATGRRRGRADRARDPGGAASQHGGYAQRSECDERPPAQPASRHGCGSRADRTPVGGA
jgi:hypothetical protein